jgi:hypothetical protein
VWRLKSSSGDSRDAALRAIRAALEAQRGRVPGLLRVEVGFNVRASRRAGDFALVCDFVDAAALDAYHKHPAHFETRAIVDPLIDEHWIVDYEVDALPETDK